MRSFAPKPSVSTKAAAVAAPQLARIPSGPVRRPATADEVALGGSRLAFDFSRIRRSAPVALQAKLTVNAPGDAYEQEADRVAEEVMRMPEPPHASAGGYPERTGGQNTHAQMQTKNVQERDPGRLGAPPIVHDVLRSPGCPLDAGSRAYFEPRYGHEFGRVRLHSDSLAHRAAAAVDAKAFAVGPHLVFAAGEYAPHTPRGMRMLAHELAHVVQQGAGHAVLQRSPDDEGEGSGDLKLPWKHGDSSLFEQNSSGIRFLVAGESGKEDTYRAPILNIAKQIAADNARIKDPAFKVLTCIVAPTTTRFALLHGKPTLMLDPKDENVETAVHEMGHAIFFYLEKRAETKEKDAPAAANFRSMVADIYLRLSQTKEFTSKEGASLAAGLWIADPSQWKPGSAQEHPWQDADEFFASAKEAYQVDRKGFARAIGEMVKVDPDVKRPANELLALLRDFLGKGKLPAKGLPEERAEAAQGELKRLMGVSNVEDTLVTSPLLGWLLQPETRP